MVESIHKYTDTFLGHFPLPPVKNLTLAGLKCFMAIWRKCNITHRIDDITVNAVDRYILGLSQDSYRRGLVELEDAGLITVKRASGKCNRISVCQDKIDKGSIKFVLSGKNRFG